ncbi:lipid-A-disaccharide synthase N-terminal domain-containing protein [Ferrovibrio sp.]|uniref:lipid-A-disaccharide synthase N-terminal domain-containing protein n=1 Tax=Ferrovibrio sp. TaxID=1917215 RepID=UPI003D280AD3
MLAEFWDRAIDNLSFWAILGFGGQAIFASRFIVQWIHAERVRRSEIPLAFWYISLFGGVTLLVYAIHRADLVFILGQISGLVVYARNLHLIYRERRKLAAEIT